MTKDECKKKVVAAMKATEDAVEDIMRDLEILMAREDIQFSPRCCELLGEVESVCQDVASATDWNRCDDPESFDWEPFDEIEDDEEEE